MHNTIAEQVEDVDTQAFINSFRAIQLRAHNTAKEKGFHNLLSQLRNKCSESGHPLVGLVDEIEALFVLKALGLITEEIGEAMSAYRENNKNDDKLPHRLGIEVEMSDAVIRIMDLAGYLDLDIAGAMIEKMSFNSNRPYMHGKVA